MFKCRYFLLVGLCGGFTTFSTFMNENFQFIKDDHFFYLCLYLASSLFGGFLMLYLGHLLSKQFGKQKYFNHINKTIDVL